MNPKSNSIKKILILVGLILAALSGCFGACRSCKKTTITKFIDCRCEILCQHGTGTGMKCGNSVKELWSKCTNCKSENKIRPAFCSQLHRSSNCPRNCPSR
ncbi:hypothetical protein BY996DRAFT_7658722 [Phakopsora pachyrhizi]|uniref:Lipoprotein n=1 Tax=Phakopsora pachyrhizi TaxID=170000 RepID=A0A0S1MJ58_PHAPC|nr:hypothetical protein BY996DRAFT_7658722 [Phakopsora pachyrhizi]